VNWGYIHFKNNTITLFFDKPTHLESREIKILRKGKQPGIILPHQILFQIRPVLFEGDNLFLTFDDRSKSLKIHLDWNSERVFHIILDNPSLSIDEICKKFCSSSQFNTEIKIFVIDCLREFERNGTISINSGLVYALNS
jgi:hypothetical protein